MRHLLCPFNQALTFFSMTVDCKIFITRSLSGTRTLDEVCKVCVSFLELVTRVIVG